MSDMTAFNDQITSLKEALECTNGYDDHDCREIQQVIDGMDLLKDLVHDPLLVAGLIEAINALPVEELVQEGPHGEPELVGYGMQAQGEWDEVTQLIAKLQESKT